MNTNNITTIAQLTEFINGLNKTEVTIIGKETAYPFVQAELNKWKYWKLKKVDRGIVKLYLRKMTGYSRSQITRLITKKTKTGVVKKQKRTQPAFQKVYTRTDIELLAEIDNLYRRPGGPALRSVMHDEFHLYGNIKFKNLASISSSHIYNLRSTDRYKEKSLTVSKTKSVSTNIGTRTKPDPEGKPGYIRVDTVHQGDLDKVKGVYHIHFVDEVTQWDITVCVAGISELFLQTALEEALGSFPFVIINFHSDNGSEFINKTVAKLLNKLHISQTKSRARKTNDNALVEGKNASVVRKTMGHSHIPQKYADSINTFYKTYFNPHVNFHRKCAFVVETVLDNGKIIKKYPHDNYHTPYQKLSSLANWEQYLISEMTAEKLADKAFALSHFESARILDDARTTLFKQFTN